MKLRADHLTLGRIVLLPLPVAMLHGGANGWVLGALIGFVLLGLTDLLDGPLARRTGSSPIGPLLDNLSDRVFLAVVWCILAEIRIVPIWFSAALLTREFLVVGLRASFHQDLRSWRGGQLKTTVQMFGSALLLLLHARPSGTWFAWAAGLGVATATALGTAIALRQRRLDWRAAWGVALTGGLLATEIAWGAQAARQVTLLVIGTVTLASGAQLLTRFRREVLATAAAQPLGALRVLGEAVVCPLLWTSQLTAGVWIAMPATGLVAAELAVIVLGNALRGRGHDIASLRDLVRVGMLGATGVAARLAGAESVFGTLAAMVGLGVAGAELAERARRAARSYGREVSRNL